MHSHLLPRITGLAVALPLISNASAQVPELLLDIQPETFTNDSSFPSAFQDWDGKLFFTAFQSGFGNEPWLSDGTPQGTSMLADIQPGLGGSISSAVVPVEFNGYHYFEADDGSSGKELWRSNGTTVGTQLFHEFFPGLAGSSVKVFVVGDRLLVAANSPATGVELWASEGNFGDMELLVDLYPGPIGGFGPVLAAGDTLYFVGNDNVTGPELWKTDATSAGTQLVADMTPGPNGTFFVGQFVPFAGEYYFTAALDGVGQELFATDGTAAGTRLVADIRPGPAGSDPTVFPSGSQVLPNGILFTAEGGASGREPWFTDGTAAGTIPLPEIYPGPSGSFPVFGPAGDTHALMLADSPTLGTEPWLTDGTPTGTFPIDLASGLASGAVPNFKPVLHSGKTFFASTTALGLELAVTDGTEAGTKVIKDLEPGSSNGLEQFKPVKDSVAFFTLQGKVAYTGGEASNTHFLPAPAGTAPFTQLRDVLRIGSTLYVSIRREDVGSELFRMPFDSDGDGISNYLDSLNAEPFCLCSPALAPCGNDQPASGCTNSTGQGARMIATGTTTAAVDDLSFRVGPMPANAFGLLVMSPDLSSGATLGDGVLCLGNSLWRLALGNSDPAGLLDFGPGLGALAAGSAPAAFAIQAGQTWRFQTWYRDNGGPCGSTSNVSSGLSVVFTP